MAAPRFSLGLTGHPIRHSLSPRLHRAALKGLGLDGGYRLYPVPRLPQGEPALRTLLQRMRGGDLHGLNVTIPHKQAVLPWLDGLTEAAAVIGAVNTLFMDGDRLVGDNTDAPGFLADLRRYLPQADGCALVLGAGGAARAVIYALAGAGWQVIVTARREAQAAQLAGELRAGCGLVARTIACDGDGFNSLNDVRLIVNATPVGMTPHMNISPWLAGVAFPDGAFVYDLVYTPTKTALVHQAHLAGLPAAGGLGMLVEQAALSFERWTGLSGAGEAMRRAAANLEYTADCGVSGRRG